MSVVREHYLREDISCKSELCVLCPDIHRISKGACDFIVSGFDYSVSALKKDSYTFSVLKCLWLSMNIINDTAGGILSGSVSHYVLPDVQCVQHYLELWQHPAITDLILLQTALTHVI